MDIVQAYATAAGSILAALMLWNIRSRFSSAVTHYLLYPHLLPRNRFLPPLAPAEVFFQTALLAANTLAIVFRCTDVQDAARRAGRLALVNMVPLSAGPHLAALADLLDISLARHRALHRLIGWTAFALLAFHALVPVVTQFPFPVRAAENRWALTVSYLHLGASCCVDARRDAWPSASSRSPPCPYCAGCGTSSSSALIRRWLCFLHTPSGGMWSTSPSLLRSTCTSSLRCSPAHSRCSAY